MKYFQKFTKTETLADSSIDCHTAKISKYIDHQLQLHVKELNSYVKDSTDFIRKINSMDKITDNSIFVTMDILSLCTNISNKEGIEAVETTVRRKNVGTRIISTFLHLFWTLKVASAAKLFFCRKECPWYVINEFFYLKKKYVSFKIHRFQNLWQYQKHSYIIEVSLMLISFES